MGLEGISKVVDLGVPEWFQGKPEQRHQISNPQGLRVVRADEPFLDTAHKAPKPVLETNQQKAQYVAEQLKGRDLRDELLTLDEESGEGAQVIMRVFQDALQAKDLADWEQELFNSTAGRWLPKDT